MSFKTARWFKTLQYIFQRYQETNCSAQAAALTLDTLLSLVPLLATSVALVAAIPSLQHMALQAEQKLLANFVFDTGHNVQAYLQQVTKQAATVSIVGALILLVTAIKMLYTLNQSFQAMLVARIRQKTVTEIILSCFAWILAPIFVGIGIAVSSYIISLPFLNQYTQQLTGLRPLLAIIPILLNTIAFGFLYMVSPLFIVPIRNALIGAFCAAVLFEISKWLFGLYIVHFPSYQALYGALAAIPLFILWLYLSWQIALLGALIAQAMAFKDRYRSSTKLDGFTHAICWLGHFWRAENNQQSLSMADLIEKDKVSYAVEPEAMLEKLRDLELIEVAEKGKYRLAQNIQNYTLHNCFHLFPWKQPTIEHLQQLDFSWKENLSPILNALAECESKHLNTSLISVFKNKKS